MLDIRQTYHPKHLRFRRWSRKGYAIFVSLSHNVTIGKVCNSICNLSLQKSSGIISKKDTCLLNEKELDENEDEVNLYKDNPTNGGLFSIVEIINQTLSLSSVVKIFIVINNPAVGISMLISTAFFMQNHEENYYFFSCKHLPVWQSLFSGSLR